MVWYGLVWYVFVWFGIAWPGFVWFCFVSLCLALPEIGWDGVGFDEIGSYPLCGRWASLWIFDAFWHLLYFFILLAISYMWSPNKNNLQYAYMDELGQAEEEEEEEEEADAAKS